MSATPPTDPNPPEPRPIREDPEAILGFAELLTDGELSIAADGTVRGSVDGETVESPTWTSGAGAPAEADGRDLADRQAIGRAAKWRAVAEDQSFEAPREWTREVEEAEGKDDDG